MLLTGWHIESGQKLWEKKNQPQTNQDLHWSNLTSNWYGISGHLLSELLYVVSKYFLLKFRSWIFIRDLFLSIGLFGLIIIRFENFIIFYYFLNKINNLCKLILQLIQRVIITKQKYKLQLKEIQKISMVKMQNSLVKWWHLLLAPWKNVQSHAPQKKN